MSVLTNKLGPLPTWGWLAIATGGGIAWYLYEAHKNGTASSTDTGSTSSSNVPDYVFQNYNQEPPTQAPPTTTGTGSGGGDTNKKTPSGPSPSALSKSGLRPGGPDVTASGQPRKDIARTGLTAAQLKPGGAYVTKAGAPRKDLTNLLNKQRGSKPKTSTTAKKTAPKKTTAKKTATRPKAKK